jgi:hypothetical protein
VWNLPLELPVELPLERVWNPIPYLDRVLGLFQKAGQSSGGHQLLHLPLHPDQGCSITWISVQYRWTAGLIRIPLYGPYDGIGRTIG